MAGGVRTDSRSVERQIDDLFRRVKKIESIKMPNKINKRAADAYDKDQISALISTLDRVIRELEKING